MGALPADPQSGFLAGVVLLGLAALVLVKASIPRWRDSWGWGRSSERPISLFGHMGIALAFAIIGIGSLATRYGAGEGLAIFALLLGFAVFILTGICDTAFRK